MLKSVIHFLRSIKLFIITMAIILIIAIISIVIPQEKEVAEYTVKFGKFTSDIILFLKWNKIYSTLWFIIPLGIFCINLATCLVFRLLYLVKRPGKWGSFVTHSGVLLIIIGGMIQYLTTSKHSLFLIEGETENVEEFKIKVTLDSFEIKTDSLKSVSNYVSYLNLIRNSNNHQVKQQIKVNSPLSFENVTFYQISYGQLPNAIKKLDIIIVDSLHKDTLYNGDIGFRQKVKLTTDSLLFQCDGFLADFMIDTKTGKAISHSHQHRNPAFHYKFIKSGNVIHSFWGFPAKSELSRSMEKYSVIVKSYEPLYYSGIMARKSGGSYWILAGFACLSFGMIITFMLPLLKKESN